MERDDAGTSGEGAGTSFQLTRSRGAWQVWRAALKKTLDFNSHAHVERDPYGDSGRKFRVISTHTLTWSVTIATIVFCILLKFQLTRSRGAWHTYAMKVLGLKSFQLTRSRGAWLLGDKVVNCSCLISTHTLTWSVTTADLKISADVFISTHTLTWSVTCRFFLCRLFICHFNSHAHVERDGNTLCCFACLSLFQLTRSRGAWRIIINTDTNSTDFNSHAHVERDQTQK